MMLRNSGMVAITLSVLIVAVPAAATTKFSATLSGLQQSIPNDSGASGTGFASLSSDDNTLTANLSWTGLSAPAAMAHIHCCAPRGADAPVALDLMPMAVETGPVSHIFDLTALSSYSAEFLTAYGNSVSAARTAFVDGFTSGQAYFNIHDVNFPAGEIRGQLDGAAGAVPEPASWSLMIAGFALAGGAMRRRQNVAAHTA